VHNASHGKKEEQRRQPRHDVQTTRHALSGEGGKWLDAYHVGYATAVWELRRLAAALALGLHCNYSWRVRRLEEALGLDDGGPQDAT
jgi:hypothetical protein